MSKDSETKRVDPLDLAGITLTEFTAKQLSTQWKASGGAEKLERHLAAHDQVRCNPDSLRHVIVGSTRFA